MRSVVNIAKALSDENRVRIVCALSQGELCVCQIQELLGLAHSTTSKHLSVLANAGLLEVRREGRWSYYRLATEEEAPHRASLVLAWVCGEVCGSKALAADCCRLASITSITPEELCRRQASGGGC